jgi:hypothetical protein
MRSSLSLVVFLALTLGADSALAVSITRGPYLQMGTETSVTVRWRTDVAVPSVVEYGTTAGLLDQTASDLTLRTEHELQVDGLNADTQYWYGVSDGSVILTGADSQTWWRTSPPRGTPRPLRIWVLGDSGLAGLNQNAVRDAYLAATGDRATDLVLLLGDNAYASGTDYEYQFGLFLPYASVLRTAQLWPARGNHDTIYAGANDDYFDFFTLPTLAEAGGEPSGTESWFSFDVGNVHFVCFDSYQGDLSPPSDMLDWIAADLAANDLEWTIVLTHYPPYTKGSHDSDVEWAPIQIREQFVPVLEAGGVDLVLNGHSHGYERSWLMDGHYGDSTTFTESHKVDSGDGDPQGDGPYRKASHGPVPHSGTVYCVAGSASRTNGGVYDHPAMLRGEETLGSLVLEIDGSVLTAEFLTITGTVHDRFSIEKGTAVAAPNGPVSSAANVWPNPFAGSTRIGFSLQRAGAYTVEVFDLAGRRVRTLRGESAAGPVGVRFDGRDDDGRYLASGSYLYRITTGANELRGRLSVVR